MQKYLARINSPDDLKKFLQEELPALAEEIRQEIINVVFRNGGHLGSNLGVVELTLALHYVFDVHKDIFVWDVSDQTYTHKILTGRKEQFHTLRQYGGLSGFSNKEESPYDHFTFGHAGTAISTALGIVCGDELAGNKRKVIAIVGDGAITSGIAYEALNNCGHLKKNLLIILNDNAMSISPTIGALSKYLSELRTLPLYKETKKEIYNLLTKTKAGTSIEHIIERLKTSLKASLNVNIFNTLGFEYYGPIDGHDIKLLIRTLQNIKRIEKPILLHIVTKKGKGCREAEKDSMALHGVSPKLKETKVEPGFATSSMASYTQNFAKSIIKLAEKDKRVVAITAAMPEGTGLVEFGEKFPNRFFDVGICEQHAVALAAGLAYAGLRPIVAIYSTFLQRSYDQIFQEICLQNLPVIFAMDRSGLVGQDGPTHHGVFDIAYLRAYPNIILMAPKDGIELEKMLEFALKLEQPSAIRYPRANIPDFTKYGFKMTPIELGKQEVLTYGEEGVILAYGSTVETALLVAEILLKENIKIGVINARFAKPVDTAFIKKLVEENPFVLTLEEHSVVGGFGSSILESASSVGVNIQKIKTLGIPDKFITHGERSVLLKNIGLDGENIANAIRDIINSKISCNKVILKM